jgi:hypothetical protein
MLKLYPNLVNAPPVLNSILGLGSIVLICLIANALLKSRLLSLAVACVTAFQPIMVWLSLSGLADGMGIFAALVGVFGWVRYRFTGAVWLAILSAAGFLCATAVKTEYAAFAAGFALLAGFEAWRLRGSVKSRILIACIPLAGLFMIIYMIWWKMLSGSFMGFSIAFRANYENTWIAALTPTPLSRFGFFPKMLWQNWPIWISLACIGLVSMALRREMRRSLADLIIFSVLPLGALCLTSMSIGVPDNLGPGPRHVAVYMALLLIPAMYVFSVPALFGKTNMGTVSGLALVGVAIWSVTMGIPQSIIVKIQSPPVAVQLGRTIAGWWDSGVIGGQDKVFFEPGHNSIHPSTLATWVDTLTVSVFNPEGTIVDDGQLSGNFKWLWRQPILNALLLPPKSLVNIMRREHIRAAVVHSPAAANTLAPFMSLAGQYGDYSLFVPAGDERLKEAVSRSIKQAPHWLPQFYPRFQATPLSIVLYGPENMASYAAPLRFNGDFSVSVDFSAIRFPKPAMRKDLPFNLISLYLAIGDDTSRFDRRQDTQGGSYALFGPPGQPGSDVKDITDMSGRLRLRRIGKRLFGDFWRNGQWVNVGSHEIPPKLPVYVSVGIYSSIGDQLEVKFSNFSIDNMTSAQL